MEEESIRGFEKDLEHLINKHSMENGSNTPDFILATYLRDCLLTFNKAVRWREKWYGREPQLTDNMPASN